MKNIENSINVIVGYHDVCKLHNENLLRAFCSYILKALVMEAAMPAIIGACDRGIYKYVKGFQPSKDMDTIRENLLPLYEPTHDARLATDMLDSIPPVDTVMQIIGMPY